MDGTTISITRNGKTVTNFISETERKFCLEHAGINPDAWKVLLLEIWMTLSRDFTEIEMDS